MARDLSASAQRPTLRAIFDRLDRDRSGAIDAEEVAVYLGEIGIGKGWFGGQKVATAVDKFMEKLDGDGDRQVTWDEFVRGGKHLLPPALLNERGELDPARVERFFTAMLGQGREHATEAELAPYLEREINAKAKSSLVSMFAGTIAEAAAKVAVDALDADGDRAFTRQDLFAFIDDINTQLGRRA